MEATNFCRQMVETYGSMLPILSPADADDCKYAIDLANNSVKFILPSDGITTGDLDMRAIDCDVNLPFTCCALEYLTPSSDLTSKVVLLTKQHGRNIMGWGHVYPRSKGIWTYVCPFMIVATRRLDNGSLAYSVKELGRNHTDEPLESTRGLSMVILDFINALSCSNVHSEQLPARKKSKRSTNPLPFDVYHYLTVSNHHDKQNGKRAELVGGRKGCREHLRRGHIRRYQTGEKVWVNACVVGHNNVGGTIKKDYQMKGLK